MFAHRGVEATRQSRDEVGSMPGRALSVELIGRIAAGGARPEMLDSRDRVLPREKMEVTVMSK